MGVSKPPGYEEYERKLLEHLDYTANALGRLAILEAWALYVVLYPDTLAGRADGIAAGIDREREEIDRLASAAPRYW